MNSGLYAACAGLLARTQALDLAAHNLANVNTSGYRAQVPSFRSVLAGTGGLQNAAFQAVDEFGVLAESRVDAQQGPIERTGNDLDVAIQGSGYFAVQTASGGRLYTRNGSFHVDNQSRLVTADGNAVLGAQGPILLPWGKVSISSNGTVCVDGALAAQLLVVGFPASASLTPVGATLFSAVLGQEAPVASPTLVQGSLEGSNVNAINAAVGLVALQRHADMLQRALTAFHSEFNRIAAQDLSRV
jgi:flagellar basal-body rod protein FlgF/flagellar basal-body rod protein FlgG